MKVLQKPWPNNGENYMNNILKYLAAGSILAEIMLPYLIYFVILHFVIKWW